MANMFHLVEKEPGKNKRNHIKNHGYPANDEIIPDLLGWLRDINWPGSLTIAEYVRGIGETLLQYLPDVFTSDDDIWIGWVISKVIHYWPEDLREKAREIAVKYERPFLEEVNDPQSEN
ncbi:DUF5071 domain-containing protein [Brevibacillus laterosporus]|uniref:DUF5071 domain-containing protein n=1 Tax=Brevibacillus laterosporus TaxID=1465 RepID=UPI001586E72F|nr:DUF5071 domain-containing protein [Brevibacillus laterosporus]